MEKNKTNIGCVICEDIFKAKSKFYYNPDINLYFCIHCDTTLTPDGLDYLLLSPSKRLY